MSSRILVVDDDRSISALLACILKRKGGYDVVEENHSFRVVAVAREFRPDLVLLDIDMPGKNGYAVALELSQDSRLEAVPILFLTALVSRQYETVLNTVTPGVNFMAKSSSMDALLERIAALLPSRRTAVGN
jgi:DNA-binding response OmpR family regulator